MIQRRAGAIVNMASGADVIGIPQTPIYDASKHAVLGLTKSAAIAADLVFEFTEAIRQLYNNPDFPAKLSEFPPRTVAAPHLFRKVAVPGICVG